MQIYVLDNSCELRGDVSIARIVEVVVVVVVVAVCVYNRNLETCNLFLLLSLFSLNIYSNMYSNFFFFPLIFYT